MNLQSLLAARVAAGKPVRVGLIGAGKFGSMFLAQVPSITGLDIAVIADLDPERAKAACRTVGWDAARIARTRFAERGRDACGDERVEVVVEATGDPARRHRPRARSDRGEKTYRHGQCRSRRARRRLARTEGPRRRRDLFHGLRRSAGADCRNGRLGARGGLQRRGGGQGHQISAGLSHGHAGRAFGSITVFPPKRPSAPA